ncbi:hypothetical protein, partial [Mesorhizobium sp. M0909]|uniref:hypothetical protein n=1 Tax=Mesorhizobium sp. M0909 TaxID=2957024 RepID=UPI003337D7EB
RQWLAKQRYRGAHALELPSLNGISYPLTHDLGGFIIDIGNYFLDNGPHDALLEPGVRRRRRPDSLEVCGQRRDARCQHR